MVVSSDGHYGGVLREDGWVEQIDLETGAVVVEGWHRGAVALALSPSALVTVDPREAGWWTRRGSGPDRCVPHGCVGEVGAAMVDLGAHVVVWGGGRWGAWRTLTARSVAAGLLEGGVGAALGHAWTADGASVARLTGAGQVDARAARGGIAAARWWLWDASGGWTLEGREVRGPSQDARVSPGVDVLWSLADGALVRWSALGQQPVVDGVRCAAGHPSDRYVLVEAFDGSVRLHDAGDPP